MKRWLNLDPSIEDSTQGWFKTIQDDFNTDSRLKLFLDWHKVNVKVATSHFNDDFNATKL